MEAATPPPPATTTNTAARTVSTSSKNRTMIRRLTGLNKKNMSWVFVVTVMLVLLMTAMVEQAMANPLNRLLKMNSKSQNEANKQGTMMKSAKNEGKQKIADEKNKGIVEDDNDAVIDATATCIDSKLFTEILEKEKQLAEDKIETLTSQLEEAVENSKRMTELKEDLVHEMAKFQSQSGMELSQAREELASIKVTLEAKEHEFTTTKTKWEERLNITKQLAEVRQRETETLWKHEMEIVKTNAQLEIQSAQHDAGARCREQMEEQLSKLVIKENTSDADTNNDRQQASMVGVQQAKIKALEDENKQLETQLEEQKITMKQLTDQLEARYEAKFNERERELQEQLNEHIQQLEEQEACQSAIDKLKKTQEQHLTKYMELCNQVEQSYEQEKDANLKLSQNQTQLQGIIAQLQQEKEKDKTELQSTIEQLEQQMEIQKQSSEQDKEMLKGGHLTELQTLKEGHATAIKALEKNITNMEQDVETMKKRHEIEIQQTELRVQNEWETKLNLTTTALRQEMHTVQERTTKVQVGLEENIQQTKQVLQQQTSTVEERNAEITRLTKELKRARNEVEYWERVFMKRSYFNSTQVQDDAITWTGERKKELIILWKKYVWRPWMKQTEPYRKKLNIWYSRYLKKYVDPISQILIRFHTQYIVPILIQPIQDICTRSITIIRTKCNESFQHIVTKIRHSCPQLQRRVKKQPNFIRKNVERVCQQPEKALSQTFWFILIVVTIVFRNPIGRFLLQVLKGVWWLLTKLTIGIIQLLWFISPFPWLLRLLHKTKVQDQNDDGIHGAKQSNDDDNAESSRPKPATNGSSSTTNTSTTNGVKKEKEEQGEDSSPP